MVESLCLFIVGAVLGMIACHIYRHTCFFGNHQWNKDYERWFAYRKTCMRCRQERWLTKDNNKRIDEAEVVRMERAQGVDV